MVSMVKNCRVDNDTIIILLVLFVNHVYYLRKASHEYNKTDDFQDIQEASNP